jgi:hypothetical protein
MRGRPESAFPLTLLGHGIIILPLRAGRAYASLALPSRTPGDEALRSICSGNEPNRKSQVASGTTHVEGNKASSVSTDERRFSR